MKISTKEQQRAEFLLQSQRIQLHQIERLQEEVAFAYILIAKI